MGKQINFYMDRVDEKEFIGFVKNKFNLRIIIGQRHPTAQLVELKDSDSLDDLSSKTDIMIYLVNIDITRFDDVRVEFIQNTKDYFVEIMNSFIIEYSREVEKYGGINYGRIYIPTDQWKYHKLDKTKIKQMTKWYNQLERWIKKRYKKIPNDFRYVGPHTLEEVKKGKLKLISQGQAVFYRTDVGETGNMYDRKVDEIEDTTYIENV